MPVTWRPQFPRREPPKLPENLRIAWGVRFPLLAGSACYFAMAAIHITAGIQYASLWQAPLAIACLTCCVLLARLSRPAFYEDLPRFKRLARYYIAISTPYFLLLSVRALRLLGLAAYDWGVWWFAAFVTGTLAAFGAMVYFTVRGQRKPDARSEVELLAEGEFSTMSLAWMAFMVEFPPI